MSIQTGRINLPEPKAQKDRQPRDEKGKWHPPMTAQHQPKEQPIGSPRPMKYIDTHRAVTETALSRPTPRIEAPSRAQAAAFTKKEGESKPGKAGKGTKK